MVPFQTPYHIPQTLNPWGLFSQIPWDVDDYYSAVASQEEGSFKPCCPLIVEHVLVPLVLDKLRQHDCDDSLRMLGLEVANVVEEGVE